MIAFYTDLLVVAMAAVMLVLVARWARRRSAWLCAAYLLTCVLVGIAGACYWVVRLDPRIRLAVYTPDDLGDVGRTVYCAAVAVLWTSLVWAFLLRLMKPRRPPADACEHCGYLLRGLTSNRCPECGTPVGASFSA